MARGRRPCFFKVLLGDHYSQNVRIPGAFLKYFNGKIPKQFHLRTPVGTWRVDTEIVDNKLYIQKGWEKFVLENGIKENEFVVFRYTENSVFNVSMYGIDMCKKSYLMATREETNEEDDSSVEILGDVSCRRGRRGGEYDFHNEDDENEFEEESGEEDETEDNEVSGSEEATENEDDEDHNDDSDDSSFEMVSESKTRCKSPSESQLPKSKLTKEEEEAQMKNPLRRANVFAAKSTYPYCVIRMAHSYALGSYLSFPSYFAKEYLKEKPTHALFRTNGRTWPVKFDYSIKYARVVGGWYKFSHQCNLEEDDVCVFMLTDTVEFSFDVEIVRISEAAQSLPGGKQTAATELKSNMEGPGRKKK